MAIDILHETGLLLVSNIEEGDLSDASILCEMPHHEGNEGSQKHHYEEWPSGYPGHVPGMRHQDVQDWEGLKTLTGGVELCRTL